MRSLPSGIETRAGHGKGLCATACHDVGQGKAAKGRVDDAGVCMDEQ
jgi:hypothetical protein